MLSNPCFGLQGSLSLKTCCPTLLVENLTFLRIQWSKHHFFNPEVIKFSCLYGYCHLVVFPLQLHNFALIPWVNMKNNVQ